MRRAGGGERLLLLPTHVLPLPNPPNDVRLMVDAPEALGFDVGLVNDAHIATMSTEIQGFAKRFRRPSGDAGGLFYCAAGSVESRGVWRSRRPAPVPVNARGARMRQAGKA